MHIAERYALSTGSKIEKPFIYTKFFPLPFKKYVTFHAQTKPAKTYDHFQDVIDILLSVLDPHGIKIIQLGSAGERTFAGVHPIVGQTDLGQTAFLIKNGLGHFGVDSCTSHFAGHFDKKLVCLYSNNYINNVKPFWGKPENQILLEPDRSSGRRPSFALEENPKTINEIKPEVIAKAFLKLLGLNCSYDYSTEFVGGDYVFKLIEGIPDQTIDVRTIHSNSLTLRMDYLFDENALAKQLSLNPCSIVTDRPIDAQLLNQFKGGIIEINYEITENHNLQFVKYLFGSGFKFNLFSYLPEEQIAGLKLDYMDFGVINKNSEELPQKINAGFESLFYKSHRLLLSSGKVFASKTDWLKKRPCNGFLDAFGQFDNVYKKEYARELRYFRVLSKNTQLTFPKSPLQSIQGSTFNLINS